MKNLKVLVILTIFFIGIIYTIVNTYCSTKNEYLTFYNFKITKIEVTPTKQFVFFNKNNKVILWNYRIMSNEDVRIGDILYKEKCSKYLYILRENEDHEMEEILKVVPTSPLPMEWFCN